MTDQFSWSHRVCHMQVHLYMYILISHPRTAESAPTKISTFIRTKSGPDVATLLLRCSRIYVDCINI